MNGFDVEAVLRDHALVPSYRGSESGRCAACHPPELLDMMGANVHRAHVAAVLREQIDRALRDERDRAAWEVQRVINHWSSVPADVLADRFAELADLEACRDRVADPYRPTLAAIEGD